MITSADIYRSIEPVVAEYFGLGEKSRIKYYEKIADVSDVDAPEWDAVQYGGPGVFPQKNEGAPVEMDQVNQGWAFRWKVLTHASGMIVTREAAKDTKYSKIMSDAKSMGRGASETPNYHTALFLDNAFDVTKPVIGDGLPLCHVAHTTPSGVTFANTFTDSQFALTEEGVEQVGINLELFIGEDGMPLPIKGKKLVFHPSKRPIAEKLMMTTKKVGTNYNDISVIDGTLDPISFPHLSGTEPWFVITEVTTDGDGVFYKYRERPMQEREPNTSNLSTLFVSFFRATVGCKDARGIYGSNAS
jgi:hypothetical protein